MGRLADDMGRLADDIGRQAEVSAVQDKLNSRARKRLDDATPHDNFYSTTPDCASRLNPPLHFLRFLVRFCG
jgi:hypothetical protein